MNNMNNKHRKPTSFTLSADTIEKLEQYAKEHHTNKSQAITDLIWACPCSKHEPTEDDLDFASGADLELVAVDNEGNALFAEHSRKYGG